MSLLFAELEGPKPAPPPDERIFGRRPRPSRWQIGVVAFLFLVVLFYLGFTKRLPLAAAGSTVPATSRTPPP